MSKLGKNWQSQIREIIEDELLQIALKTYIDKTTGEVNFTWLNKWLAVESFAREKLYKQINKYRDHSTYFRKQHNMNPFAWEHETEDRIRQYVHAEPWQLPKLRKLKISDDQEEVHRTLTTDEILDDEIYLHPDNIPKTQTSLDIKPKPGQHFIQRNVYPEYRVRRSTPPTFSATDTSTPFNYKAWDKGLNATCERMNRPVHIAEPLESLIALVAEKHKEKFL